MRHTVVSRGVVALSIAAASLLMWALPGRAGAAIQLGQVSPTNALNPCNGDFVNNAQKRAATAPYAVPSPGGVITRWSHRGVLKQPMPPDTPRAGRGQLQVWDPVNLVTMSLFLLLGRSEVETFTPGVETTFLTRIPVGPGEQLGIGAEGGTGCYYDSGNLNDEVAAGGGGQADPGETRNLGSGASGQLLNVSAVLEPDVDRDTFGDETQDGCPGQAGADGGCPPGTSPPPGGGGGGGGGAPPPGGGGGGGGAPSNEFSFGKLKKNKRKGTAKLTVEVPGPGELALTETNKVKGSETQADAAGDEKLPIKPKGKAKQALNRKGNAKVEAEVTFTPDGGASNTENKKIKLVKR